MTHHYHIISYCLLTQACMYSFLAMLGIMIFFFKDSQGGNQIKSNFLHLHNFIYIILALMKDPAHKLFTDSAYIINDCI